MPQSTNSFLPPSSTRVIAPVTQSTAPSSLSSPSGSECAAVQASTSRTGDLHARAPQHLERVGGLHHTLPQAVVEGHLAVLHLVAEVHVANRLGTLLGELADREI